jgi:hypothetical protein
VHQGAYQARARWTSFRGEERQCWRRGPVLVGCSGSPWMNAPPRSLPCTIPCSVSCRLRLNKTCPPATTTPTTTNPKPHGTPLPFIHGSQEEATEHVQHAESLCSMPLSRPRERVTEEVPRRCGGRQSTRRRRKARPCLELPGPRPAAPNRIVRCTFRRGRTDRTSSTRNGTGRERGGETRHAGSLPTLVGGVGQNSRALLLNLPQLTASTQSGRLSHGCTDGRASRRDVVASISCARRPEREMPSLAS